MASAIRSEERSTPVVAFSNAWCVLRRRPIWADFRNQISHTRREATTKMESTTSTTPDAPSINPIGSTPLGSAAAAAKAGVMARLRCISFSIGAVWLTARAPARFAGAGSFGLLAAEDHVDAAIFRPRRFVRARCVELAARGGRDLVGGHALFCDCTLDVVGTTTAEHHVVLFFA